MATAIYRAPMPDAAASIARGEVWIRDPGGEKGERAARRFAELPDGVFVWTRDVDGWYWLGRLGPVMGERVRRAEWLDRPFGEDEVPPAVAATFARGGRNFQRTHSQAGERRTAELWDRGASG